MVPHVSFCRSWSSLELKPLLVVGGCGRPETVWPLWFGAATAISQLAAWMKELS